MQNLGTQGILPAAKRHHNPVPDPLLTGPRSQTPGPKAAPTPERTAHRMDHSHRETPTVGPLVTGSHGTLKTPTHHHPGWHPAGEKLPTLVSSVNYWGPGRIEFR